MSITATAAAALALTSAITFGAPAIDTASQARPSADSIEIMNDWGTNHNGWRVTIENATNVPLSSSWGAFGNVDRADPTVAPNSINYATFGKRSIFGGPANMDMSWSNKDWGSVSLAISTPPFGIPANAEVSCASSAQLKCEVTATAANRPIAIKVSYK